ncbi:MAG: peroxidase [Caldilineaceae bacterium]|nr:peroxidase [Caldilineaceae bacterium]
MGRSASTRRSGRGGFLLVALAIAALFLVFKRDNRPVREQLREIYLQLTRSLNLSIPWYTLPFWPSVVNFIGMRLHLRSYNLYDTQTLPEVDPDVDRPADRRYLRARSPDGTYNDLRVPKMGSVYTRFGRNFPLDYVYPDEEKLLTPSPRTVSRELMTRHEFQPATILNLLAAAWLQFMVHDWLSHGKNDATRLLDLPLDEGDPWHENPMRFSRTKPDPTRTEADVHRPPTYVNTETHWWDGSQIYGSSMEAQQRVRSGVDGKLTLTEDNLLPVDPVTGIDISGVTGNWWLGLGLMHTLFSLEHNAICDMLKAAYPTWDDDLLFDHARLINVAVMAKIHTVEWTPGILATPALKIAMRGNWWGIAGEELYQRLGRISNSEVISGILGSPTNHHGALYAMTEEFTAVYRMHPLIPDDYDFRSHADDAHIRSATFLELQASHSRERMEEIDMVDLLYSFGTSYPGAITLHNFPRFMQQLVNQESGRLIDLASVDILRDRERGVPRYNQFRRLLYMPPVQTFEELTANPEWAAELRRVYNNQIEDVDLMVGLYAETPPPGFGFSDSAFRIFILMASRRLKSDRFFTIDYTPAVYTPEGMAWIDKTLMSDVLLRHFPELKPMLSQVENAFAPWPARAKRRENSSWKSHPAFTVSASTKVSRSTPF